MKRRKLILILLIIIVCVLIFTPKRAVVIYQNSIETKVINVELFVDEEKIENREVAYSYLFPRETKNLWVRFGSHVVKIKCKELNIEKSVEIFSLFKTNLEFEFVGNADSGFEIIERHSWRDLVYE
jgi:hypothetical protein